MVVCVVGAVIVVYIFVKGHDCLFHARCFDGRRRGVEEAINQPPSYIPKSNRPLSREIITPAPHTRLEPCIKAYHYVRHLSIRETWYAVSQYIQSRSAGKRLNLCPRSPSHQPRIYS